AMQGEIERQRQRLSSAEIEERRDALMRLGNLKRPDASRAAIAGLSDATPVVRVAAAHAILSLPPAEVVALLSPLLQDKSEFVRREAAYTLGETHSRAAVEPLSNALRSDKEASVRAAAAVALGVIKDESAVPVLVQVLGLPPLEQKKKKAKPREDEFVLRAAARSLGQIRSRAAVAILIAALRNQDYASDIRREAAIALGLIGDSAAVPALQAAFSSDDLYLSEAAREALRRLRVSGN
ncbi:MAG: HEAT repeat domain-containing protein, partial [Acidobacteriota bacterium]